MWERSWTSWAVLREIEDRAVRIGKGVRIVPFTAADRKEEPNAAAFAEADDSQDAAPWGVRPFKGQRDNPRTAEDERLEQKSFKGSGQGSASTVHYDPADLNVDDPCRRLTHELVHSLRELRGQF